jgi:D-amino-acid dehydrogenase
MKTVVIGAGIIGIATAYFLHKRGHDVTVVERRPSAALETSFANGGVVHASEVEPWSQPGMPGKILRWLGREDAPLLLRPGAVPHMWRWGIGFLRSCTVNRFHRNTIANLHLALHSLKALHQVRAETGIEYDSAARGVIKTYHDPKSLAAAARNAELLGPHGLLSHVLSAQECGALEPALTATLSRLAGGLYFPRDEVGDCYKFTEALARHLAERKVSFLYETNVSRLVANRHAVDAVETSRGRLCADCFVVAAGSFTSFLLRPLGITVQIYPVKGLSITVDAAPWREAVRMPVIDDSGLFGLVPIGDRLRVSGSAEIARYDPQPSQKRADAIVARVVRAFPDFRRCYNSATARIWAGLRPVTPTGTPYMGQTRLQNLFVNAGHGHLGWTMGCGAGEVVAALASNAHPEIDLADFPQAAKSLKKNSKISV